MKRVLGCAIAACCVAGLNAAAQTTIPAVQPAQESQPAPATNTTAAVSTAADSDATLPATPDLHAAAPPDSQHLLADTRASDSSHIADAAIRAAIRDTLAAEHPPTIANRPDVDTLRTDKYTDFDAAFEDARVPDCLHSDGLKRQPTGIFFGWLALPFVIVAKVRGVCN